MNLNGAEKTSNSCHLTMCYKIISRAAAVLWISISLAELSLTPDFTSPATVSTQVDIDYTITCEFYLLRVTSAAFCAADLAVSPCFTLPPHTEALFLSSVLLS